MKANFLKYFILLTSFIVILFPEMALAHIKWFIEFDMREPPQSLFSEKHQIYYAIMLTLSLLGVSFAIIIDRFWHRKWGDFNFIDQLFSHYDDIALNIARIGTGVFFVGVWLVGGILFTPELLTENAAIAYIQLMIATAVLFRRSLILAGLGILLLYSIAVYEYGLFHLIDYITLVGLAIYLMLSANKSPRTEAYRLPILYYSLIFSFIWSAIEKIAYPEWFYGFLTKHHTLTMGLDLDFFIASMAFVEFTLFFLLLIARNGTILVAFIINLVISSGNIYFGKMDAIGHFPANFILLIILIKGATPFNHHYLDYSMGWLKPVLKGLLSYLFVLAAFLAFYYSMHWLIYVSPLFN